MAGEVAPRLVLPPWIRERSLQQPIAGEVLRASLGPGESEAISLALEIRADRLIVDERAGRRVAEALGLRVAGVLGLLVLSKQRGLIPTLRPQILAVGVSGRFRVVRPGRFERPTYRFVVCRSIQLS